MDASLAFDATSNPEQNKDEIGTLMARMMGLAERADITDELAAERDRLRRAGSIL